MATRLQGAFSAVRSPRAFPSLPLSSFTVRPPSTIENVASKHDGVNMLRLLVTGGAGYIGSVVADALLRSGHDPATLIANPDKVTAEPGWHARQQSLDAIVGSAWEWMVSHRARLATRCSTSAKYGKACKGLQIAVAPSG
jgi:hypothetical protein